MSYSCTQKAHQTLSETLNNVNGEAIKNYNFSNTWEANGNKFFYERGRENIDGSITGTIFKFIGDTQCIRVGSLKIFSNGSVKSWPGMPKNKIIQSNVMFQIF